jgi:hypothetical protein
MRLYSQAQTYPMTHDIPTTMTNATRDTTEGVTFGSSAATSAPKHWASNRIAKARGETSAMMANRT